LAAMTLVSAAALVACGGGGSSSDSGTGTGTGTGTTVALSGTVAKGPATGAKVKVYATNADGTQGALLAQATTVAGGGYTVNIPAQTNPVLVVADLEGATIVDETSTAVPQATYTGAAGNTLRAVLLAASGTAVAANVTPFSEVAADLAADAGGYKAANVEGANSKVRTWLGGVDHLSASVTDAATLLPRLRAVQTLVNGSTLTAVLAQFKDASTYSAAAGGYVINGTFSQALKDACTGTSCGTFADATVAQTPVPPVGTVEPVKAFIQDLRDTLLAYSNSQKSGALDIAGAGLSTAFDNATSMVGSEQLGLLTRLTEVDRVLANYRANPTTSSVTVPFGGYRYGRTATHNNDGSVTVESQLPVYGCQPVNAVLQTTSTGQQGFSSVSTTGLTVDNVNAVSCFGMATEGRLVGTGLGDANAYYPRFIFIPRDDGSYRYVSDIRSFPLDRTGLTTTTTSTKLGVSHYGSVAVTRNTAGDVTAFTLQGQIAPALQGLPVRTLAAYSALKQVDTDLAFSVTDDAATAKRTVAISGSFKLIKTDGSEASSVALAAGSKIVVKTDAPNNVTSYEFGGDSCPTGTTVAPWSGAAPYVECMRTETYYDTTAPDTVALDVTVAVPGAKLQGVFSAAGASYDKSRTVYSPTTTSFQGKVYEADGTGYRLLLDGKFSAALENFSALDRTAEQSATNFAPVVGGFEGKILIKNRPEMSLVLALRKVSVTRQTLDGTFGWNGKSLTLAVDNDEASAVASFARLSNSDGVQVTFPKGGTDSSQDLLKGGVKVGTLNLNSQRIDYTDGTFEQF
jgi:hypothetical protein